MKIVFFGTPEFVIPVLKSLSKHHDVVGVVTAPDAPSGRNQEMKPSPIKVFANQNQILVFSPQHLNPEFIEKLQNLNPDFLVVAAYGQIIPQAVLEIPKHLAINIHPSMLPKYRGPSPVQATILHGETETGVTIIEMDDQIDHGPILAQHIHPVDPSDTFETLVAKLFMLGAKLTLEVIEDFAEGDIVKKTQQHEEATFTDHLSKQSGFVDLANPPDKLKLDRMIRAYHPWPGVWTRLKNAKGKEQRVKLLPGRMIQVEGKSAVSYEEFINGYQELKNQMDKFFS